MTVRPFYDMWPQYNRRLRDVIAAMTDEQLAIRPSPDGWPIWAIVGHTAGGRVYWLCDVLGEGEADATPFSGGSTEGWEDDLDHPRGADELAHALDSTFSLIEGCLDRWTPDMFAHEIRRYFEGSVQIHTRGSILQRIFSHEAYHCGELSQTLGIHGLPQIDLWRPTDGPRDHRTFDALAARRSLACRWRWCRRYIVGIAPVWRSGRPPADLSVIGWPERPKARIRAAR